jgi:hypothetical protein
MKPAKRWDTFVLDKGGEAAVKSSASKVSKAWIAAYAAMITAVAFADQARKPATPEASPLSPVVVGGNAPSLALRSVVRRTDI